MADSFLDKLLPLLSQTSPDIIKDYLLWSSLLDVIPHSMGDLNLLLNEFDFWMLSRTARQRRGFFSMYSSEKVMNSERESRCVFLVTNLMPHVLGNMYNKAYMDSDTVENARNVTKEIISSFSAMIDDTTWLTESTRMFVEEKIKRIVVETAIPKRYRNASLHEERYGSLQLNESNYLQNVLDVIYRKQYLELQTYLHPADIEQWAVSSASVNAFYQPTINAILVPAGEVFVVK